MPNHVQNDEDIPKEVINTSSPSPHHTINTTESSTLQSAEMATSNDNSAASELDQESEVSAVASSAGNSVHTIDAIAFEAHLFSKTRREVVQASEVESQQIEESLRQKEEERIQAEREEPRKVLLSKQSLRVVEGGACDFYTVRLSHAPEADVMVQIEDTSGQVRASPKVVRFLFDVTDPKTIGHWALPQKVRVMAVDDDNVEAIRETANLTHCSLSGDPRFSSVNGRCLVDPEFLPVNIVDNDGSCVFMFGEVNGHRELYPSPQRLRGPDIFADRRESLMRQSLLDASATRPRSSSVSSVTGGSTKKVSTIPEENICTVACGASHFAVVLADGRIFTAGRGAEGQLCHGDFKHRVELSPWRSIDRDGILRSKITQVACGIAHTALITDDGRLLMCGSNQEGQLGLCDGMSSGCSDCREIHGHKQHKNHKGYQQNISSNNYTKHGGAERQEQISSPKSAHSRSPIPTTPKAHQSHQKHQSRPPSARRPVSSQGGGCARARTTRPLESQTICAVPRVVEALSHLFIERVACGDNHTVVLASTGSSNTDRGVVKCRIFGWGETTCGALGCGLTGEVRHPKELTDFNGLDPFQISCGSQHTAVLCGEGKLYTAGWGIHGCVSRRKAEDDAHLNYFEDVEVRCAGAPPAFVEVTSGHSHLGALTDTSEVYMCGLNECGQLGMGDTTYRTALTRVGFLSGLGVASLACGMFHSAAITWDGCLYVWGSNDNGQLGLGSHVLHQTLPALHTVATGEAKQVHAGHAQTVVIMHKSLACSGNGHSQRVRQHQERVKSFWSAKRRHDRAKQARVLNQPPRLHEKAQRRKELRLRVQELKNQRLDGFASEAALCREIMSTLPYDMVTQFSPRIMTQMGREAKALPRHTNNHGPDLPVPDSTLRVKERTMLLSSSRKNRGKQGVGQKAASIYGYDETSPSKQSSSRKSRRAKQNPSHHNAKAKKIPEVLS